MNNSLFETSPFKGSPRPEQTEAWDDLLRRERNLSRAHCLFWRLTMRIAQAILVTEDDLKAINKTSIKLADDSGYIAILDVFHEIHCLYVNLRLTS